MIKQLFFNLVLLYCLCSCVSNGLEESVNVLPQKHHLRTTTARMKFDSSAELQALLEQMKNGEEVDIATRSTDEFVSLNDYLIQVALDSLTEEDLKEIQSEGLVFDPEDSLIADPYFCECLNANREIEVEGKVYKYIAEGILRCDPQEDSLLNDFTLSVLATKSGEYDGENFIALKNSLEFMPMVYETKLIENDEMLQTRASSELGDLVLENGIRISSSCIRNIKWGHKGDAGWLQHGISKLLCKNTVVESNFDKKHRMKLRMYEQDYVVAKTIGMTLRMQKRVCRIWWRKKADEFHYGWTGLELQYRFKSQPMPPVKTPDWPKTELGTPQLPDHVVKKFPFYDNDIVLFYVPFAHYSIETNDVNKLFWSAMNHVSSSLKSQLKKYNKQGVFTTEPKPKDKYLRVTLPHIEKHAYNDGREVYRFDTSWWSGNYLVGVQVYPKIKQTSVSFSAPYEAHIERGCVYGVAKWNGVWRGARIYTGD